MDKVIWFENELSVAEYFKSKSQLLLKDYLNFHPDFYAGGYLQKNSSKHMPFDTNMPSTVKHGWTLEGIKFVDPVLKLHIDQSKNKKVKKRFPTACEIVRTLGNDCGISTYSVSEPGNEIKPHIDRQNPHEEYIRIHIPLIIPAGEAWLEVEGSRIPWTEIIGFNNNKLHGTFNGTDQRRLIFIIDVRRTALGIK